MRISDWSSDVCSSDLTEPKVPAQALGNLEADGLHRVQRRHRFLEHHGEAAAAQPAQLRFRQRQQVAPLEEDLAACLRPLRQQPPDRQSVVKGKSVSGRVDLRVPRTIKKKKKNK